MTPTQIAEKARSVASQMKLGDGRSALEGFADWIDEQERQRIQRRDNVTAHTPNGSVVLIRDRVYDLTITRHRYAGKPDDMVVLRHWVFDGKHGFMGNYLQFHKLGPEDAPWRGARREINRDDLVSATEVQNPYAIGASR